LAFENLALRQQLAILKRIKIGRQLVQMNCGSRKLHQACIFNNFIRQLAARIDDASHRLRRSRSPIHIPAVALFSAPAHPLQAINGFATDGNNQSSSSISDANAFSKYDHMIETLAPDRADLPGYDFCAPSVSRYAV